MDGSDAIEWQHGPAATFGSRLSYETPVMVAEAPVARSEPADFALGDGRLVLCRRERMLLRDGEPVTELGSRAIDTLLTLVEGDGALLTKGALLDRVWAGVVVEENNLQVQISALRRALGPEGRCWITTVPGRGYRFTGPVSVAGSGHAAAGPRLTGQPCLSVLVLPFAGHGSDPARDWFADAVTGSLTTDLARALPPISGAVVAQATADVYAGQSRANLRAIGRSQGARYLVEGSVLLAEDRVRVNAQLVAAETGAHIWGERFDTKRGDTLAASDEIVSRLARAMGLQMLVAEALRAECAERERPDAGGMAQGYLLRAYAAGASQDLMTRHGTETARALCERALELEPENADALAAIGCLRVHQVVNGSLDEATGQTVRDEAQAREDCLTEADDKLARALAIAPGHLGALKARAVLLRARGQFEDAIAAAETVLARNPAELTVHREIGLSLLFLGRAEAAVGWFQRADAVAPNDPVRWTWLLGLGCALIHLDRDAEAVDALRLAVASNPTFAPSHALLAAALALAGEDAAARAAMAEFRRAEPDTPVDLIVRRSAVPFESTDPLYQSRQTRVRDGLRRAATLNAPPQLHGRPHLLQSVQGASVAA